MSDKTFRTSLGKTTYELSVSNIHTQHPKLTVTNGFGETKVVFFPEDLLRQYARETIYEALKKLLP